VHDDDGLAKVTVSGTTTARAADDTASSGRKSNGK
jgi:hypothetical protein